MSDGPDRHSDGAAGEALVIWMPYTRGSSGSDVSTQYMAEGLRRAGHHVHETRFAHFWQYVPGLLRRAGPPPDAQIAITNSWSGFAFARPGLRMITVERLFVADDEAKAFRTAAQGLFHDHLIARYVARSYRAADAVVCLSASTLAQVRRRFPEIAPRLILNAVDTGFFSPPAERLLLGGRAVRLLFVGNLTRRKGVDLIPRIMAELGSGYELRYTSGLRTRKNPLAQVPNALNLGRLNQQQMRDAYRSADLLLLPSRLEGLSRAVMEAQACGLPAIVSDASSLPESIKDGITGRVCRSNHVVSFASAVRGSVSDQARFETMCEEARRFAVERHSLDEMVEKYVALCREMLRGT